MNKKLISLLLIASGVAIFFVVYNPFKAVALHIGANSGEVSISFDPHFTTINAGDSVNLTGTFGIIETNMIGDHGPTWQNSACNIWDLSDGSLIWQNNSMNDGSSFSVWVNPNSTRSYRIECEGAAPDENLIDGSKDNVSHDITVNVNVNQPPILNFIGDKSVNEGELLSFAVSGSDPDGNSLSFWVEYDGNGDGNYTDPTPAGIGFDPPTKTFSWTPNFNQAGTYPRIRFVVYDGSLYDWEDITITVNDIPLPTALITGDTAGTVGTPLNFNASASGTNLNKIEIWKSPVSSADWGIGPIATKLCGGANTCNLSGSWTPTSAGEWYTVVNAYDNLGNQCTGNPFGISAGWADCDLGGGDTLKTNVSAAPLPNQPPIAEASIVVSGRKCKLDGTGGTRCSFENPLEVNKGDTITISSFDADIDINGDSKASYDPDGWTDSVNGVSTGGGKCEWNYDLDLGGVYDAPAVMNPASPTDCSKGPKSATFNIAAGTHSIKVLKITDKKGAASNESEIKVIVNNVNPPTASINGDTVGTVGTALNFNASASGTNLDKIEIYKSPSSSGPWNFVDFKDCEGNNTCNWSGSWTPNSTGDWYTVVNAHDNSGNKCTGNSIISLGWTDCGGSDSVKTTVNAVVAGSPPIITFDASKYSILPGETIDLSWNVQNVNNNDCVGSSNPVYTKWDGNPINSTKTATGNELNIKPAKTTEFTLTCKNADGTASKTRTIRVGNVPGPIETLRKIKNLLAGIF